MTVHLERGACIRSTRSLSTIHYPLLLKLHFHCYLHGNRLAVFLARLEPPLLHRRDGALFERRLIAAQHADGLHVSLGVHAHQQHHGPVLFGVGRQHGKFGIGSVGRLGRLDPSGDPLILRKGRIVGKIRRDSRERRGGVRLGGDSLRPGIASPHQQRDYN